METRPYRIVIVEPTPAVVQACVTTLRKDGHALHIVATAAEARRTLAEAPADLVMLDLQLPDGPGIDLLRELMAGRVRPKVIAMTAAGSVQTAVETMRAGAADVLLLPVAGDRLRSAVSQALSDATPAAPAAASETAAPADAGGVSGTGYVGFVGTSPTMQGIYRLIESAAPSKATVFITGESGTGKEVCAEAIHRRSPRSRKNFVPLNCAAIPKDLMESEIFGHLKGAFTGATSDRTGGALQADGGTLFLDEICEMDLSLQAKLLRFLQTGLVKKVGSEKAEPVDVRILCATNRDPYAEVQSGRFREDLFYRLQVISIELPPLRERGDDVILIARQFLAKYSLEEKKAFKGFSPEAERILRDYSWPGNVRQLLNVVRNVVVLNDGEQIEPFMLPPPLNKPMMIVPPVLSDPRWTSVTGPMAFPFGAPAGTAVTPAAPIADSAPANDARPGAAIPALEPSPEERIRPLWQVEEEAIDQAIRLCSGNITRAAALLEINPCTIYRRRQKRRVPA